MSDLFGDWVPKEWITKVLDVVSKNQQWYFLFLTKNPSRYIEFKDLFGDNCLLGATADTQKRFDNAIDAFTKLKYEGVTFVSMEPMEEEIDMVNANLDVFQWLIVGGRSKTTGAEAKQPEWEWVEKVLLQAREKSIAVYFKPNLTVRPEETPFDEL
jgi:protein gp37